MNNNVIKRKYGHAFREMRKPFRCSICGSHFNHNDDCVFHHIDYKQDIVIPICRICHAKIHSDKINQFNILRSIEDKDKLNGKLNYYVKD